MIAENLQVSRLVRTNTSLANSSATNLVFRHNQVTKIASSLVQGVGSHGPGLLLQVEFFNR